MRPKNFPHLIYFSDNFLVLDFETSNLDKGSALNKNNTIVCACWYYDGEYKSKVGTEYEMEELLHDISMCDFLIAQNAKFELQWLMRCGLDITKVVVWDTMIAEYVFAGNRSFDLDLDSICERHGIKAKSGWIPKAIKSGICPTVLPISDVVAYCAEDVAAEKDLFLIQRKKYINLLPVIYNRCYLTPALADIEINGMHIDAERVEQAAKEVSAKKEETRTLLEELTGGINPRSPKQVAAFLYDELKFPAPLDYNKKPLLTPSGNRPTDTKIISKFVAKTERQKKFLELKKAQGVLDAEWSKCVGPLSRCCAETSDHVLYASFNQAITQTQRLSSSGKQYGVQFQNFPRKYKNLFKARREGWFVVEADAAQLEFRVAAFLGQDEVAINDIVSGADIHSFTAAVLNDVPYEWMLENKKTDPLAKVYRQEAKSECFPMDTELLTPSGFKKYDEISIGDEVINYNAETMRLENDIVIDYAAPHKQEVISMSHGHNWEVTSTPGHRWYCTKRVDKGVGGRIYEPRVVFTEDVNTEHRIITSAPYKSEGNITPDEAALIAWSYADGNVMISQKTGKTSQGKLFNRQEYRVRLIQKQGKPQVLIIDSLLSRLGITSNKSVDSSGMCRWELSSINTRPIFRRAGIWSKEINHSTFVLSLSEEARKAWLGAICLAEGTRRKHGEWRIAQNSGPLCEAIKLAGFLCGHDIRTTRMLITGYNHPIKGKIVFDTPRWHEQITLRTRPYVTGQRIVKESKGIQDVWCVTTNNRTVVIRQGDTISISGNTFKPLYGGQSGSEKQKKYYAAFKAKYKGIANTQQSWVDTVLRTKKLQAATGFVFYWPDTTMSKSGYVSNTTSIYNYPIQQLATADIIPVALGWLWRKMKELDMKSILVNTVHDSIIAEVPEEELALFSALADEALSTQSIRLLKDIFDIDFNVPLESEIKVGTHWGE